MRSHCTIVATYMTGEGAFLEVPVTGPARQTAPGPHETKAAAAAPGCCESVMGVVR